MTIPDVLAKLLIETYDGARSSTAGRDPSADAVARARFIAQLLVVLRDRTQAQWDQESAASLEHVIDEADAHADRVEITRSPGIHHGWAAGSAMAVVVLDVPSLTGNRGAAN